MGDVEPGARPSTTEGLWEGTVLKGRVESQTSVWMVEVCEAQKAVLSGEGE